jgi:hypothetical protein
MAKFPANPADNADAFMALHVGSASIHGLQDDNSSDLRFTYNFFVLCGIYKGVLWTDVLIHPGVETANSVYNAYKSSTELGDKVRLAARNSTEIELRQLLSPQDIRALLRRNGRIFSTENQYHDIPNAKFGVYIAVDYSARASSKNTYRAVVILEWNSFRVAAALYREAIPSIPLGNLRISSQR